MINNIEIIEGYNRCLFESDVNKVIKNRSVVDIKFAVTPNTHEKDCNFNEKYYAMIIFR